MFVDFYIRYFIIRYDCEYFGMELFDLEVVNELKVDMFNFESMWGLYE